MGVFDGTYFTLENDILECQDRGVVFTICTK